MTLSTYNAKIDKLQNMIHNEEVFNRLLVIPANVLMADIIERITQKGLDSNGNKIGDYSKKKSWATEKSFDNKSNFKPNKKKNGEKRKSIDLEDGYYELRELDGYQNKFVDLMRTGNAVRNITVEREGNTNAVIGFTDKNESVKIRSYEEKNNKIILNPTANETQNFIAAQKLELTTIITELFSN